ncbi:hypothetical protein B0A50_03229 [Salinomyces thailandicus]|uniref:Uncharacterized protein n=1 Tax=Salinomyces thailandicus TaxID=706561 RepID=A0A4U0U6P3_9PEZI|nr:hypothetical protein B0A50_03229 [Salinomyces thailandica]
MAQAQHAQQPQSPPSPPSPAPHERKRVKVYELKNNDWYDRGTGFCSGQLLGGMPENPDARIVVVSEDDTERVLLETRISKDDGYQKQQDTLIVWTEVNGVDMALSFQEADGCSGVWGFVNEVQQRLNALAGPDDGLSDDILDPVQAIILPEPELGKLDEVEQAIRAASATPNSREALVKSMVAFISSPGSEPGPSYIMRLGALVEAAEKAHSVEDLHRLCNIIKHLILLNDTSLIEHVVSNEAIQGVVGALEYDPDFPSHKANHRQYLADTSKFKQVVPITNAEVVRKIHTTYRLLYLKDVVLARILDDPTFSVLNSLIFFYQVDVVNYLQGDADFLRELFGIFRDPPPPPSGDSNAPAGAEDDDQQSPKGTRRPLPTPDRVHEPQSGSAPGRDRKKDAVLFIRDCCAIAKNIQAQSRASLFQNFISHGLFSVITYALRHHEASVRVAGTDVLVALIDHDPGLVRNYCFQALQHKHKDPSKSGSEGPLTDTLIELLLVEVDLGVKSQMADAIKILLDPNSANGMDMLARQANAEILAKRAGQQGHGPGQQHGPGPQTPPQTDTFIQDFYEHSAMRLFKPLMDLAQRGVSGMKTLSVQETSLYTHLVEILCFFVRQHTYRSKLFILAQNLHSRIAQLLACPQKHMRLTALKWFRVCVSLQDEFHNRQLIQHRLFEPILAIVEETQPRDNLLNSACLDLFEYIKREGVKQLILHLAETYRDRLLRLTYVSLFELIVQRYDQFQAGYVPSSANGLDDSSFTTQEGTPRVVNGRQAFSGLREMDNDEEAYFDDIEDDEEVGLPIADGKGERGLPNGAASPAKPLVNYPEDEDEDAMDILASSPDREGGVIRKTFSSDEIAAAATDADAPGEDAMEVDSTSPSTQDHAERGRGRDRRPVPLEGSPGKRASASPPAEPPLPVKRRRNDEDEDELGMLMGGSKRRNSAASLASQTHHIELDGSVSPSLPKAADSPSEKEKQDLSVRSPPQTQTLQAKLQPQPALKRRGSLKTRNQGSSDGKFIVKPIALAAHAHAHAHATARGSGDGGNGNGDGTGKVQEGDG